MTNCNRKLLNRVKVDQGDVVHQATVGDVNIRETTAKEYDDWALHCEADYKRRGEPNPPLPMVRLSALYPVR